MYLCISGVVGLRYLLIRSIGIILESLIIEGENPVQVRFINNSSILSSAGHEKSCVNLAGPSAKAKYSPKTDSEPVPWGKGEKHLE